MFGALLGSMNPTQRAATPGSLAGMSWTEPVTVTLPGPHVEKLRTMVATGRAKSMSAWIAAAVDQRLTDSGGSLLGRPPLARGGWTWKATACSSAAAAGKSPADTA